MQQSVAMDEMQKVMLDRPFTCVRNENGFIRNLTLSRHLNLVVQDITCMKFLRFCELAKIQNNLVTALCIIETWATVSQEYSKLTQINTNMIKHEQKMILVIRCKNASEMI